MKISLYNELSLMNCSHSAHLLQASEKTRYMVEIQVHDVDQVLFIECPTKEYQINTLIAVVGTISFLFVQRIPMKHIMCHHWY